MAKLFLPDIGHTKKRTIEVTHFPHDGELQFECFDGDYIHLNFSRKSVDELHKFLNECVGKESYTTARKIAEQSCTIHSHFFWRYWHDNFNFCPICGKPLKKE